MIRDERTDETPGAAGGAIPAGGAPLRPGRFAAVVLVWAALVGGGTVALSRYAMTEGARPLPPAVWPADSRAARDASRPTLVVFLHPQCPCSRATVGELARVLADCDGRVSADVLFLAPSGVDDAWVRSDLWRSAEAIPGVRVSADVDGAEARRFRVETSGEVLYYDADGRLAFAGGVTAARGHAGDSIGRDAVLSLALTGRTDAVRAPIFGCTLFDDTERPS